MLQDYRHRTFCPPGGVKYEPPEKYRTYMANFSPYLLVKWKKHMTILPFLLYNN
jgi:hypothetical protein